MSKKQRNASESSHLPQRRDLEIRQLRPDSYRSTEPLAKAKVIPGPVESGSFEPPSLLTTTPLESTNAGKNPESRFYIRGVLHLQPWSLRFGALFALLLYLITPLAIAAAMLVVSSGFISGLPGWISNGLLILPALFLVVGLCYLIWARGARCRICHQPFFVQKISAKHSKSHKLLCLGHVLPLSLHLLLFSWFRCSSCGTCIRLKK